MTSPPFQVEHPCSISTCWPAAWQFSSTNASILCNVLAPSRQCALVSLSCPTSHICSLGLCISSWYWKKSQEVLQKQVTSVVRDMSCKNLSAELKWPASSAPYLNLPEVIIGVPRVFTLVMVWDGIQWPSILTAVSRDNPVKVMTLESGLKTVSGWEWAHTWEHELETRGKAKVNQIVGACSQPFLTTHTNILHIWRASKYKETWWRTSSVIFAFDRISENSTLDTTIENETLDTVSDSHATRIRTLYRTMAVKYSRRTYTVFNKCLFSVVFKTLENASETQVDTLLQMCSTSEVYYWRPLTRSGFTQGFTYSLRVRVTGFPESIWQPKRLTQSERRFQ